jgi:hypothetical protein
MVHRTGHRARKGCFGSVVAAVDGWRNVVDEAAARRHLKARRHRGECGRRQPQRDSCSPCLRHRDAAAQQHNGTATQWYRSAAAMAPRWRRDGAAVAQRWRSGPSGGAAGPAVAQRWRSGGAAAARRRKGAAAQRHSGTGSHRHSGTAAPKHSGVGAQRRSDTARERRPFTERSQDCSDSCCRSGARRVSRHLPRSGVGLKSKRRRSGSKWQGTTAYGGITHLRRRDLKGRAAIGGTHSSRQHVHSRIRRTQSRSALHALHPVVTAALAPQPHYLPLLAPMPFTSTPSTPAPLTPHFPRLQPQTPTLATVGGIQHNSLPFVRSFQSNFNDLLEVATPSFPALARNRRVQPKALAGTRTVAFTFRRSNEERA